MAGRDYIFAGRVRFRITPSDSAVVSLRSIITLINKGILFALFIDVCFETNVQPDYLDYLGHCNYISLIDETAMEMMNFSRDIFTRYRDREKGTDGQARERTRGG